MSSELIKSYICLVESNSNKIKIENNDIHNGKEGLGLGIIFSYILNKKIS
jgi:hypothetical protein